MEEIISYDSLSEKDKALNDAYGVTPEQTGFRVPVSGCIKNCTCFPCIKCDYYYGELHECMRGEVDEYELTCRAHSSYGGNRDEHFEKDILCR